MDEKDILKIVEDTFNEEIYSSTSETILGLESQIEGKEEFMKNLSDKLKILFLKNNQSK